MLSPQVVIRYKYAKPSGLFLNYVYMRYEPSASFIVDELIYLANEASS